MEYFAAIDVSLELTGVIALAKDTDMPELNEAAVLDSSSYIGIEKSSTEGELGAAALAGPRNRYGQMRFAGAGPASKPRSPAMRAEIAS